MSRHARDSNANRQRKTKNPKPKTKNSMNELRGWLSPYFITQAGKRRGPYYVRCWKEKGKLRKVYVRLQDVNFVRAACERFRQRRRRQIHTSKWTNTVCANIAYLKRLGRKPVWKSVPKEDFEHVERIASIGIDAPGRPIVKRHKKFMGPFRKTKTRSVSSTASPEEFQRILDANAEIISAKVRKARKEIRPPRPDCVIKTPEWLTPEKIAADIAALPLPYVTQTAINEYHNARSVHAGYQPKHLEILTERRLKWVKEQERKLAEEAARKSQDHAGAE